MIIDLYNNVRPHWSLQHKTPMSVYRGDPFITPAARWFNNQEEEIEGSKKEKMLAEEKNEVFGWVAAATQPKTKATPTSSKSKPITESKQLF